MEQLPNVEFLVTRPASLKRSLLSAIREWRYDGALFRGARGVFHTCYLMPYFWESTFANGVIPSVDEVVADLGEHSRPFVYQARGGLIRELHVGLFLVEFGTVTKNYSRDIFEGVDLSFEGIDLAIRHDGAYSDQVWSERKAEKSQGCVVLNAKGHGTGIHLCRLADIRAACGLAA